MSGAPQLAVVVDTEEEFDWSGPFLRAAQGTESVPAQSLAHEIFDRYGVVPTYVMDYPVAKDPKAVEFFAALHTQGRAELGTHLHPWVTPPHTEDVNAHNSYHCNLPPELERAKLVSITDQFKASFGFSPRIFKAGRYGFGANTQAALIDLGYEIDCSFLPHVGYARGHGPDYYGAPTQPFWLDEERKLLEIPLTSGFIGVAAGFGTQLAPLFDCPIAQRISLIGLLARTSMISRARLTPEGVSVAEQCRLLRTLVARGERIFTLTYHSPSLGIGHTPYVKSESDRAALLNNIDSILRYFRDELGGEFSTLTAIRSAHLPLF